MKRSTQVSLVLLASVSAVATLSGCGESQPEQIADKGGTFTSMAECVAVYDQQTCTTAQQMANKEHLQNAPHFNSQAQCAAEYGADMCRPASAYGGSSNVFMPMMMGYLLGSATSTPAPLYYGNRYQRDHYNGGGGAPIFTSGNGYNRGAPIGAAPFASNRATVATTKGGLKSGTALQTGTVAPSARGGFGNSFKPTQSFKQSYATTNPSSFGRAALPTTSARFSSISASRASASSFSSRGSSISSRGGFGGGARSFGGGFGG